MEDTRTTLAQIKQAVQEMVEEREWQSFHSLKNLSMNITREASELQELFLWVDSNKSDDVLVEHRQKIEDELADVLLALCAFANVAQINLARAFAHKIEEVKKKYPCEEAKGRSAKYTQYKKIKSNQ